MFNETINSTMNAVSYSMNFLSGPFFERILLIIKAPFNTISMLWMLLPILATLIMMEFYFGGHKDEELGWNTAYGNALILIFVSIDLFRHVYEPVGGSIIAIIYSGHIKIIISLIVSFFGLVLVFIDFFHFLPKKVAYTISSPAYINLIALLGIIIVYTEDMPLDWITFSACVTIFISANIILQILYFIIPSYKSPLQRILTVEDVEKYAKNNKRKNNE